MILVADSGSTNTDWLVIKDNQIKSSFTTAGFNPYFTTGNKLYNDLKNQLPSSFDPEIIKHIFFYGSGCSTSEMKNLISNGLQLLFKQSVIEVNHDLLGAARALFKNEPGIALILGTGANTCFYDGKDIAKNVPSLGYILGDEGGGDYLGKLFITELLYENLPEKISKEFLEKYQLTKSQIMQKIYKEEHPNQFLASICEFISTNISKEPMTGLIYKSFTDLFEKHIIKYENFVNYNIRAIGSIAYYFKDLLNEVAGKYNTNIDVIVKNPIQKLANYHLDLI